MDSTTVTHKLTWVDCNSACMIKCFNNVMHFNKTVLPSFLLSLVVLTLVGHFDHLVEPDKTFIAF